MKKYEVFVDEKLSLWTQLKVIIEADNEEEAKKLALKPINHECSEVIEYYWDTVEILDVENTDDPDHQEPTEIE